MKKANSALLLLFGCILLVIGNFAENLYFKYSILFASIFINVFAVIQSFKEKRNK